MQCLPCTLKGNVPFVATLFRPGEWIATARSDAGCTLVLPPLVGALYLNVTELNTADTNRMRFKCSAVVAISKCSGTLNLQRKMYSANSNTKTGSLKLSGISGTVVDPPPWCSGSRKLATDMFEYDGWYLHEPASSGVSILASVTGWFPASQLKQIFQAACRRAYTLGTDRIDCRDALAVVLQSGAGPYTKQHGRDWRGPGLAALCTNQDCDGMAINTLLLFSALRRVCSEWTELTPRETIVRAELLKYDTPLFMIGKSERPSAVVAIAPNSVCPVCNTVRRRQVCGHTYCTACSRNCPCCPSTGPRSTNIPAKHAGTVNGMCSTCNTTRAMQTDGVCRCVCMTPRGPDASVYELACGPGSWPIGHAWAGISGPGGKFIHIEATTPGASTKLGGLDEHNYRELVKLVGGIEEIDGSHGAVSVLGVRQHHPVCYDVQGVYSPSGMYVPGFADACGGHIVELPSVCKYYKKLLCSARKVKWHSGEVVYADGAHRTPQGTCSEPNYPVRALPFLETAALNGDSGLSPCARFQFSEIPPK